MRERDLNLLNAAKRGCESLCYNVARMMGRGGGEKFKIVARRRFLSRVAY